jgi:hypothetical protein
LRRIDLAAPAPIPLEASTAPPDPDLSAVAAALAKPDRAPEPDSVPLATPSARIDSENLAAKSPLLGLLATRSTDERTLRSRALLAAVDEEPALLSDDLLSGLLHDTLKRARIAGVSRPR